MMKTIASLLLSFCVAHAYHSILSAPPSNKIMEKTIISFGFIYNVISATILVTWFIAASGLG